MHLFSQVWYITVQNSQFFYISLLHCIFICVIRWLSQIPSRCWIIMITCYDSPKDPHSHTDVLSNIFTGCLKHWGNCVSWQSDSVSLLRPGQGGAARRSLCGIVSVGVVVKDLQLNESHVKQRTTSPAAIHHLVCSQPYTLALFTGHIHDRGGHDHIFGFRLTNKKEKESFQCFIEFISGINVSFC